MTTPILKITEAANGQVDQYLTYNEALRALESSTNNFYVVDMSAGDVTLTDSANVNPALNYIFSRNQVFRTIGNTVSRVLTVPQTKRLFVVQNAGTFALTVKRGTSEISLAATLASIFYCDGTANGLVAIGSTGNYVAGPASSADNEIALFDGSSGKSLKRGPVIGTAAQANLVASNTDTTAGSVTTTGWLGNGRTLEYKSQATDDLNDFNVAGAHGMWGGISLNRPTNNVYIVHVLGGSTSSVGGQIPNRLVQLAYRVGSTESYSRSYNGASWSSWTEEWNTGNLVKTTSAADTTAGRVLQVGDAGWLKQLNSDVLGDANLHVTTGHRCLSSSAANIPSWATVNLGSLVLSEGASNRLVQFFLGGIDGSTSSISGAPRLSARRRLNSGAYSPTIEFYSTGNTSAAVQTLLGSTDNAAIRSAISASSLPPYTLATVPSAAANTNLLIMITDLTGGREPCFSYGTDWLRCSDKTIAD